MGKFMVAGLVLTESIVEVPELPLPYKEFVSTPDLVYVDMGGAGFNKAMALTWLGDEVDFMSMTSKYMSRARIAMQLAKEHIDISMDYVLPKLEGMPTAVILYAKGKKQIFEDLKDIRTVEYDADLFESRIKDKDMVVITTCNFCRPLLKLAKKYDKPLALHVRNISAVKTANKEDFLAAADILYISDDDLVGDPYDCLNDCREKYNPEIIIVGLGKRGVILYNREDNSIIEYKPVATYEVVNTIGAGNSMFAAFLHYYVKTKDPREAIKNALLFVSYKINFVGTSNGFMTEEQIEQWHKLIWKE